MDGPVLGSDLVGCSMLVTPAVGAIPPTNDATRQVAAIPAQVVPEKRGKAATLRRPTPSSAWRDRHGVVWDCRLDCAMALRTFASEGAVGSPIVTPGRNGKFLVALGACAAAAAAG